MTTRTVTMVVLAVLIVVLGLVLLMADVGGFLDRAFELG